MATVVTRLDEDLQEEVEEEEQLWREERVAEERPPGPFALIIFGATGDLTHRKLMPALYNLKCAGLLPEQMEIVGFGRSKRSDQEFRDDLRAGVKESGARVDDQSWQAFASHLTYFSGQYDNLDSFRHLGSALDNLDADCSCQNHRIFYLATPPSVYLDVVRNLGASHLNKPAKEDGWVRLIVEKPFGRDLETAQTLDRCIHEVFDESQVYRIDHYLGKETVQNLFVLRFINGIFEPIWNRNYVDHVQITAAETLGVEERGGYYETAGAIRDMLQSHLLQLLTLTAMEPPSAFTADKVRDEKVKVLDSLSFADKRNPTRCIVRGQYTAGEIGDKAVPAYRQEEGVSPQSHTETYVAAKMLVDNWRWAGVPFYLRTGKRLAQRVSEIAITFRRAPHIYIPGSSSRQARQNVLILRIQPNDGMALRLEVKVPGPGMRVRPVDMSFLYTEAFGGTTPDAYQRLLLDAMRGDSTLFARTDEVEAAWSLVTPALEAYASDRNAQPAPYWAGSWGPREADDLIASSGGRWRKP